MNFSVLLVMIASSLWALDALIRTPLTQSLTPLTIVMWEHVFGLIILSPVFIRSIHIFKKLHLKDYVTLIVLTFGSSIGGTLLFTYALSVSFSTGDFITPLLLQKLQPLLVIGLSAVFLKERIKATFVFYAALALFGSYFMSFGLTTPTIQLFGKELVVLFALGAAGLWGAGTILSKTMLKKFSVVETTFVRFLLAVPLSLFVSSVVQLPLTSSLSTPDMLRFALIAISTGAFALIIYYFGLRKTPAHIATIAELVFPLTSLVIGLTPLNPYGAAQTLAPIQLIGIFLLLFGVWRATSKPKEKRLYMFLKGTVITGSGDGKKIGFPTANLQFDFPLTLKYGVYAAWVWIDGKKYKGALHYGPRLVFQEVTPMFEVHILEFDRNIYGKTIGVDLIKHIRGTLPFTTLDALKVQIHNDVEETQKILLS